MPKAMTKSMLNPVFRKELKTSLRSMRTFIAITMYVAILGAVTIFSLMIISNNMYSGFSPQSTVQTYSLMTGFQLGLIVLIVPALTASAINGERERQTLDLLLVTKMSTFTIVIGKLASSFIMVLLLIAASLPVFGIIMYYGAVDFISLITMALFFLSVGVFVGSISIFFSSVCSKSVVAIIATYCVVLLISFGTLFCVFVFASLAGSRMQLAAPPLTLIYSIFSVNPFISFMSIIDMQTGSSSVNQIIESMTYQFNYTSGYTGVYNFVQLPMWIPNVGFNVVMSAILIAVSSAVIKPTRKSKKYK